MYYTRLNKIASVITNPLLIKKKENLQYLLGEGFGSGEMWLLVMPRMNTNSKRIDTEPVLFGSGLEKMEGVKKTDRFKNISLYLGKATTLEIENGFTFVEYEYLKARIKKDELGIKVKAVRSPVDIQRQIKDAVEIDAVKKSMQIVEKVFVLVKKQLVNTNKKRIYTERDLAQFIQSMGLKMGASDVSFPAIVASGANAAVPHHVPSSKVLKAGESIILDFGFKYKNYCSDFTRTVFLKTVPKKLEIAYNQVEKAYNESIELINVGPRRGVTLLAGDVYQKSVDILAEKKLDKYFIHSLGHGTGLEIHELPNLSPKSKDAMKDCMIFSIEPGVYIPELGGIRIEDLVYMENCKVKKFISVPTDLKSNIL